ncbi:unnamed protein product [Prunus brigantina]
MYKRCDKLGNGEIAAYSISKPTCHLKQKSYFILDLEIIMILYWISCGMNQGRPTACVRRILTRYKEKYEELYTVSFMVFKLVLNEDDGSVMQHVQLKNIEDEALFVGTNHSVSVVSSNFPKCQPNSVYRSMDSTSF